MGKRVTRKTDLGMNTERNSQGGCYRNYKGMEVMDAYTISTIDSRILNMFIYIIYTIKECYEK
jgi:hypothetical protein